jgi:voltage-gated potassium channel
MITRDEQGRAHFGRVEGFLQLLILLNMLAFACETLPGLSPGWQRTFGVFEALSVIIFTVEYLVRVASTRPRMSYVRSFMGVIDVLSVLPFYLSLGFDLRSIRVFRLLRMLRIFKLARYSAAVQRFHLAFVYAREELVLFGTAALVVLYLAAVGIYQFENAAQPQVYASVFHSLWWAIVTLTTVGYGDAIPITLGGRVFTGFVLVAGLGIVAVPTGLLAAALAKAREHEKEIAEAEEKKQRETQSGPQ